MTVLNLPLLTFVSGKNATTRLINCIYRKRLERFPVFSACILFNLMFNEISRGALHMLFKCFH